MDTYTGTGVMTGDLPRAKETIVLGKRIKIITLEPGNFDGEYKKTGVLYVLVLWLVSLLAMITNIFQSIFIKLVKARNKDFQKIIWDMGRNPNHISSFFVDRFSRFNHQSKVGAAGWLSLDIFYNYWGKFEPQLKKNFEGFITRFWIGKMANRQAVTNRFKIVTNLLFEVFREFNCEPEIRLVSIASGSAQAVIAAMSRHPNLNIKAVLIDTNREALAQAEEDARKAGLLDCFTFIRGTSKRLEDICSKFQPHVIEMVGFLDYLPENQAVDLIRRIKDCLPQDGIFLTCNIRNNPEKIFLYWVLLWPMIYRNENEFASLFLDGGFSHKRIKIFYEPFRIHGIGLCQK